MGLDDPSLPVATTTAVTAITFPNRRVSIGDVGGGAGEGFVPGSGRASIMGAAMRPIISEDHHPALLPVLRPDLGPQPASLPQPQVLPKSALAGGGQQAPRYATAAGGVLADSAAAHQEERPADAKVRGWL